MRAGILTHNQHVVSCACSLLLLRYLVSHGGVGCDRVRRLACLIGTGLREQELDLFNLHLVGKFDQKANFAEVVRCALCLLHDQVGSALLIALNASLAVEGAIEGTSAASARATASVPSALLRGACALWATLTTGVERVSFQI